MPSHAALGGLDPHDLGAQLGVETSGEGPVPVGEVDDADVSEEAGHGPTDPVTGANRSTESRWHAGPSSP